VAIMTIITPNLIKNMKKWKRGKFSWNNSPICSSAVFYGQNYEMWNTRMKLFLQAHGFDIWQSVVTGYTTSKKPLKTATNKELKRNNKIAMDYMIQ
jgi:hypothetical protein